MVAAAFGDEQVVVRGGPLECGGDETLKALSGGCASMVGIGRDNAVRRADADDEYVS